MKIKVDTILLGGVKIPFYVTLEVKKVVGKGEPPFEHIPKTTEISVEELILGSIKSESEKIFTVSILSGNQVGLPVEMLIKTETVEGEKVICFVSPQFCFFKEVPVSILDQI